MQILMMNSFSSACLLEVGFYGPITNLLMMDQTMVVSKNNDLFPVTQTKKTTGTKNLKPTNIGAHFSKSVVERRTDEVSTSA